MTGDLDAASAIGARAYEAATAEGRHDRAANAAFQWAMALTWSGRLDEAEECIQLHLEPVAAITDSRWLAWAQFTRAAIAIHRGNGATAIGLLDRAALRFDAERLIDGMVSVATVELVALRQVGDDEARLRRRDRLAGQVERRERGSYNYTRRHPFTMEAIALDDAEFARRHTGNHGLALRLYEEVARSPYPIHAALGHLGLATIQAERGETNDHAQTAYDIGISINARYVHAHAHRLIVASPEDSTVIAAEELFVP